MLLGGGDLTLGEVCRCCAGWLQAAARDFSCDGRIRAAPAGMLNPAPHRPGRSCEIPFGRG